MDIVKESELIKVKKARYWEIMSHWFAIIMLLVFPVFIDHNLYIKITEAKWHVFLVLGLAYIGVSAIIACVVFISKSERESRLKDGRQKMTFSQIAIIVYFALSCISALLSEYGKDCLIGQSRYEGLLALFLYVGIFFCMSFWGEYSERFFYAMAIAAVIVGFIGIIQAFGSNIIYPNGDGYFESGFMSTIGNMDCVSGIAAMLIPVCFCSYVILEGKLRYLFPVGVFLLFFIQLYISVDAGKIGLLAAFAISLPFLIDNKKKAFRTIQMLGLVIFTFGFWKMFIFTHVDRGVIDVTTNISLLVVACLVLGLAAIALGVYLEKTKLTELVKNKKKTVDVNFKLAPNKIRKSAFIIMGAFVLVAFLFVFFYSGSNTLLYEIHEASHLRLSDSAGSGRGLIYKNCIKAIAENPLFGTGPGTFISAYWPYNDTTVTDFAHCDLLNIAVCQGLISLAAYIVFLVSISMTALKNAHRFPPIVIMGACMVGYLIYSFFTFSIAIVSPTFWIMAGIMDKTVRQLPKEEKN